MEPRTPPKLPKWSPGTPQGSQNEPKRLPGHRNGCKQTERQPQTQSDRPNPQLSTSTERNLRPIELDSVSLELNSKSIGRIRIKLTRFRIQRSRFRTQLKKTRIQLSGIRIQLNEISIEMSGLRIPFELRPTDRQTEFPSTALWPLASGLASAGRA